MFALNICQKLFHFFRRRYDTPFKEKQGDELGSLNGTSPRLAKYDGNLLERVQFFWKLGHWELIVSHEIVDLQLNPDRAKIALLISSAHLQMGNLEKGKLFLQFSRENGCPDELIAKVLAAGIHNSLSCAARAARDEARMNKHLNSAIGTDLKPEERVTLLNLRKITENERQQKPCDQTPAVISQS